MDPSESHSLPNLLYEVISIFLEFANHRTKPQRKDFYLRCAALLSNLKLSLVSLFHQDTSNDAVEIALDDVAALLENSLKERTASQMRDDRFKRTHICHKYPRLFALKKSHDFSVIRFSSDAVGRELFIESLSKYYSALVQELRYCKLEDFVNEDAQQKMPEELLDQANHLHNRLTYYWMCTCRVTSHLVSLDLGNMDCPQGTDGYTKFNLLFACSNEHCRWQEGEISVRMPSRVKLNSYRSDTRLKNAIARGLCGVEKSSNTVSFCHLLEKARQSKARMCLQINGDAMVANKPKVREFYVQPKPGLLLADVTSSFKRQHLRPSTAELNRLALVLACTLLQLYDENHDGPFHWISPTWIERDRVWKTPKWTDHLRFYYQINVVGNVNIQQPYLLSQTNGSPLVEGQPCDDPEELADFMHHAPAILALGKALLELQLAYLGLSLEPDFDGSEEESNYSDDNSPTINADYTDTAELFMRHGARLESTHNWYYKAIDACLEPNEDQILSVREFIYKKIVTPLKLNYYINSPSPGQVQEQLDEIRKQSENSGTIGNENTVTTGLFAQDDVCIYGDDEISIDTGAARMAKDWFEWLGNVHTKVYGAGYRGKQKVKIAILDTGIELSDDQRASHEQDDEFIYKSWVDDDEEGFEKGKDDVGHGTHLATLIKKVAQHAVVHVARVFKNRKPNMATEVGNIAEAIRYAVDEWDIDIIVMSFGFEDMQTSPHEPRSILKAIRYAHDKDVTLFAAASNDGHNRPDGVAWPARAVEVICVHAADGEGTPKHTPGPADGQRVMVLGECIRSCWPVRVPHQKFEQAEQVSGSLGRKDSRYMSGTSCAAAVAAGIAAIILDYAQQFLTPDQWKRIRRVDGMKKVFEIIRDPRTDRYWWVCPWFLFKETATQEWIQGEIRRALEYL